jgi:hypothetical protein
MHVEFRRAPLDPLARTTSPLSVRPPRSTRFCSPLVLSRVHLGRAEAPLSRIRRESRQANNPASKKGKSACGVYLPDLEQPRPPDVPPGMVRLRLVKKA